MIDFPLNGVGKVEISGLSSGVSLLELSQCLTELKGQWRWPMV